MSTLDAWNADLYARHSGHHRAQDAGFLASITLAATARVADLGCGSGEFTRRLAALVPEGQVLGIDGSPSQIAAASREKPANVRLRLARLEDLDRALAGEVFDAAVSRATLHWLPRSEHPALLAAVRKHLAPGGFLRVEFGGQGQMEAALQELDDVSASVGGPRSPWFFPSTEEYRQLLAAAGFDVRRGFVRLVPQRRSMPTFDDLLGFLRSQAFVGYEIGLGQEARAEFRRRAEARAEVALRRADGSYDLDFVRIDLLAWA
jgi:trans-aconitate 2-methyltransferase